MNLTKSFLLAMLFAMPAQAAKIVAVMPFDNTVGDPKVDWLTHAIPETITTDLLAVPGIVMVERLQMREVLKEQKLHLTGAVDPATAVQIGRLLGAQVLLLGAFQAFEDEIRLTARFVDVKSGGVMQGAKATGPMKNIFKLQDSLVRKLAKNLDLKLNAENLAKIDIDPTTSLSAYEAFGFGSKLAAENKPREAVAQLAKAIKLDPEFQQAGDKFREVFWSLDPGNRWDYVMDIKIPFMKNIHAPLSRRALASVKWGKHQAFAYRREGAMRAGGFLRGAAGAMDMTNYYVKTDEGVALAGYDTGKDDVAAGVPSGTVVEVVYDPPILIFPYEPKKSWSHKLEFVSTITTRKYKMRGDERVWAEPVIKTVERSAKVKQEGPKTIETRAGVFEAHGYRVKLAGRMGPGMPTDLTYWFSPGIGVVRLKSNSRKTPFVENLVAYTLR